MSVMSDFKFALFANNKCPTGFTGSVGHLVYGGAGYILDFRITRAANTPSPAVRKAPSSAISPRIKLS
jgi:hypothetical protein